MSQYSITKKPNWSDADQLFATKMGWVAPNGSSTAITGISWAAGTATVTSVGHDISTDGYALVTNVLPVAYNGHYMTTVIDVDTYTYTLASDPGAYVSGGLSFKNAEVVVTIGNLDVTNADAMTEVTLGTSVNGYVGDILEGSGSNQPLSPTFTQPNTTSTRIN